MKRALKSGKTRQAVPLKTVTMRLPVPDIKAAQDLAHEKGLPYQTYIKMLLQRGPQKGAVCMRLCGPTPALLAVQPGPVMADDFKAGGCPEAPGGRSVPACAPWFPVLRRLR